MNNFKPHHLHCISHFTFSKKKKKSGSKISINSKGNTLKKNYNLMIFKYLIEYM